MLHRGCARKIFGKGTSVEVSSDVEGFHGAWFAATVVKSVRNKFLVEYRDLTTYDETEPLKETVDFLHIRPTPAFQLLQNSSILKKLMRITMMDGGLESFQKLLVIQSTLFTSNVGGKR